MLTYIIYYTATNTYICMFLRRPLMLNFHWQSSLGRCGGGLGRDSNSTPGENSSNFTDFVNLPQNFNRILGCPEFSDPVVPSERADPGNNLPSEQLSNMKVSNIFLIRGTSANEDKGRSLLFLFCFLICHLEPLACSAPSHPCSQVRMVSQTIRVTSKRITLNIIYDQSCHTTDSCSQVWLAYQCHHNQHHGQKIFFSGWPTFIYRGEYF